MYVFFVSPILAVTSHSKRVKALPLQSGLEGDADRQVEPSSSSNFDAKQNARSTISCAHFKTPSQEPLVTNVQETAPINQTPWLEVHCMTFTISDPKHNILVSCTTSPGTHTI